MYARFWTAPISVAYRGDMSTTVIRPPLRRSPRLRRSLRRAVRTRCQAVAIDGFRLLGQRVLDLSTRGMLLAADGGAELGEEVVLTFQAPRGGPWIDAVAEVTRVIEGWRPWDPGYAVGLRFTRLDSESRGDLLAHLAGMPPPVPRRPLRQDYAETARRAHAS